MLAAKSLCPGHFNLSKFIESMSEVLHGEFTKPITMETIIISRNNHDRLSEKKLHAFVEQEP